MIKYKSFKYNKVAGGGWKREGGGLIVSHHK